MVLLVGVIGWSRRSRKLIEEFNKYPYDVFVAIIYEENKVICDAVKKVIKATCKDYGITNNLEEFWANKLDLVIIGSPNWTHKEHIVRAMRENINIFSEKPIITKIEDYHEIMKIKHELNFKKLFATGFVLRYSPIFKKLKEEVNKIGKIVTVNATDVISHTHGSHVFAGWRRYEELSGGHAVEKAVHSLDILNWCIDSHPIKVFAFGSNGFWTKSNIDLEKRLLERDENFYDNYDDYEKLNPFTSDKSNHDNITATLKYENDTNLNLSMVTFAPNARRTMTFYGAKGSVDFVWEMGHATIKVIQIDGGIGTHKVKNLPCETKTYEFGELGVHGGGDKFIIMELINAIKNKKDMTPHIKEAFYSNNACIAITKSLNSGNPEIVEL